MRDNRPARKRTSNRGVAAIVIGVSVLGIALLVGFVLLVKYSMDRREARQTEERLREDAERNLRMEREREAARAEAAAAFAEPTRPDAADERAFAAVFDDLGAALKRGDVPAVSRAFDADRMIRELEQIRAFDRLPGAGGPAFKQGVRKGIEERLGTMLVANELARWARTDVRHVRWAPDRNEAVVITVHRADDGDDVPLRFRWWLVRRGAEWKVYDFEDLHLGLRATRTIAALATPELIERLARDPLQFQTAMAGMREAIVLATKGDVEGADAALGPARKITWPDPVQALLEFVEGGILMGRGDPAAALARFETAERLLPNMPANLLTRGSAYVALGRHDEAFTALRAYQKEVGPDALSCTLEGTALEAQGKKSEAADAFRRALDEVADHADAFNGLRRVLPNAQKKELGERLSKLKDPRKVYDVVIFDARDDDDTTGADALLDGLLKVRPDDSRALGDDIRRKVRDKKFADALAVLTRALKAESPEERDSVLDSYLFAMRDAGKALEAYAAVPAAHAGRAFRTLADDLGDSFDDPDGPDEPDAARLKRVNDLLAAHRKRAPNDPWLWYYEGAIHQYAKEYEKAERVFATGAGKLAALPATAVDDRVLPELFRYRRVACLFKAKKGLDAYKTVGPVNATFAQLAHLYDMEKDHDGLQKLLAAHRDSGDPELTFWQAHLLYRKAEYGRATLAYYKYIEASKEGAPNLWLARDEVIRSRLRAGNPKGAAESVAEFGADRISHALCAAVAGANGDRVELVRLLDESTKHGGKTWFYSDEDFRRVISQEQFRDLRAKFPDPTPPPKLDG